MGPLPIIIFFICVEVITCKLLRSGKEKLFPFAQLAPNVFVIAIYERGKIVKSSIRQYVIYTSISKHKTCKRRWRFFTIGVIL